MFFYLFCLFIYTFYILVFLFQDDVIQTIPEDIWIFILQYLDNVDVANFLIAFPDFYCVVESKSFLKQYWKRFSRIFCNKALNYLRAETILSEFIPLKPSSVWCRAKYLPSGHCVACLTNPHLLLYDPFESNCLCVDHKAVHFKHKSIVQWDQASSIKQLNFYWPECGVQIVSEKKRNRMLKKCLEAVQEDQIVQWGYL
ncbi:RH1 [Bovine adenovirus 7]|uniref:RH1 protein n=1 Tax=Bovine adenovirus 7 TaxID=10511 RepID=A0A7R7FSF0_ADEB7|nr:RH1 [Bovine adenovirus 7]BCS90538.1 RH1 [Bovine adenovirus 7]